MNLVDEATKWKENADTVIKNSKLLNTLQEFGKVEFTGSYSYNLMTSSDIDVFLIVEKPSKDKIKLLVDKFIDQGFWNRIKYANFLDTYHPRYKDSFYVGLKTDINNITWKVDVWIVSEDSINTYRINWILERLNDSSKVTILDLKKKKTSAESSYDIYDAVLNHNIDTIEDFRRWKLSLKP